VAMIPSNMIGASPGGAGLAPGDYSISSWL